MDWSLSLQKIRPTSLLAEETTELSQPFSL
jgi:hypothetical protein